MSLTTKNQLLIAFKKLVGKAHTNSQFGSANESVASNVQLDNSTIFAQSIPSSPSSSVYSITNNIVEKIQFNLVSIPLSQYTAVGAAGGGITFDGDGAPAQGTFTNGIHAYALALPTDYQVSSSNPKKGTGVYVNGQSLTASNGTLQIIPERYGASYPAVVSSSSGILAALDEEDYLLDPYSGILFLQDINRVPTSVTAYIYIGDYLNQRVSGTTAQFTTVSASVVSASTYVGLPVSTPGGTNTTIQFNSGSTFSGSTNLIYDYTTNTLSGTTSQFTTITASNITIIGTASLSNIVNQATINFNSSSNRVEILPGLFVKGNIETTASISASTAQFGTVSASIYQGLPELFRILTTTSIVLDATQCSVFAKNTVSSLITVTLPDAAAARAKEYYFTKADTLSGSIKIIASGSNLINGTGSFELNGPYQSVTLITDGSDWYIF